MSDVIQLQMRQEMRANLVELNYRSSNIYDDYDYAATDNSSKANYGLPQQMDIVAFTQSLPSMKTAAIGVKFSPYFTPQDAILSRALGAPHLLVVNIKINSVQYWKPFADEVPLPIVTLECDQVSSLFKDYKEQWSSESIERAKMFGKGASEEQLSLIDVGLWTATESELRTSLTSSLERVLKLCKEDYIASHDLEKFEANSEAIYRLLFRLLTAKYLIDRKKGEDFLSASAEKIVEWVDKRFYQQGSNPVFAEEPLRSNIWEELRNGINLTNLSPGILAHLYENLLVSNKLRSQYSIHATPPQVTEYMINQLPFKEIGRENLRIFEPFCGHAPFLTAAMGRIRELETEEISEETRHDFFQSRLIGMEESGFSRELAVNSLILADDAAGDSWQILAGNVFSSSIFIEKLEWANVILCNPPFDKFSQAEKNELPDGSSNRMEYEVLRRVLTRKPDAIGFVLPRSFLDRSDCRLLRKQIKDVYNNVRISVFPDDVFGEADQETALLIAYNGINQNPDFSSSFVSSDDYPQFLQTGRITWIHHHFTNDFQGIDSPLWQTGLQPVWTYLKYSEKLASVAELHSGCSYKKNLINKCVSTEAREGFVEGVWHVGSFLEPFVLKENCFLSTNKNEIQTALDQLYWTRPKVLLNRARRSRGYWHIEGVADDFGLMAGRNYHCMWPRDETPVELLTALINSPVANAFLYEYSSKRENNIKWINQIPIPQFNEEQTGLIVTLVQRYATKRQEWIAEPSLATDWEPMCLDLLFQIDAAVLEAYALPAELEALLLKQFTQKRRGGLPFDFPGYGVEYTLAQERNRKEIAFRRVLKRYHALVDKKFIIGLNALETEEKEALRKKISEHNAPFYKSMLDSLDARTANSGKRK